MACFTFLTSSEISHRSANKTIADCLEDVNRGKKADERLVVLDHEVRKPASGFLRVFKSPKIEMFHSIYFPVGGVEYQCINFYIEGASSSINFYVSADVMVSFLLGYQAGRSAQAKDA